MSDTTYASSMGRLKAMSTIFLQKETFANMLAAKDVGEAAKALEGTTYTPDLTRALETYRDAEAFEVAINRHFVTTTRFVYEVVPFAGRTIVSSYLKWWDIENITAIIAAKAYGRLLAESDTFIISDRKTPTAVSAGVMSIDDLRSLLSQPTVDAVVQQLTRFGYGVTIMEHLDEFVKTKNLFPITRALEVQYYSDLLRNTVFFQGDEWVVRQFIADEIDMKNILMLLKGKDSELPAEVISPLFLNGGILPVKRLQELASVKSVEEAAGALGQEFGLAELVPQYKEEESLVPFEISLGRRHVQRSIERMRVFPLSLAGIFHFLLRARNEREDLRRLIYGKLYNVPQEKLARELLVQLN